MFKTIEQQQELLKRLEALRDKVFADLEEDKALLREARKIAQELAELERMRKNV